MKDIRLSPEGLHTSHNPWTKMPRGAASSAVNVLIREDGVVSPRRGFTRSSVGSVKLDWLMATPAGIHYSINNQWYLNGSIDAGSLSAGGTDPPSLVDHEGYTYGANFGGPFKRVGTVVSRIGMERPLGPETATATSTVDPWMANNTAVAYRLVYRRYDATTKRNLLSPPSGRVVVINTSGGARSVVFPDLPWPAWHALVAGDTIQVYRTSQVPNTVTPSDEMYLAVEHVLTSGDIATGYLTNLEDRTPDETLGASLYTNETQDGALRANYPPPHGRGLAYFNGSMFYGRTTRRPGLALTLQRVQSGGLTAAWGQRALTAAAGSVTSGASSFTTAAIPVGLVVGQYVTDATTTPASNGTYIQGNTKITSITGAGPYTIGIDKTILATTAGAVSLTVHDWLAIGSGANGGVVYAVSGGGWSTHRTAALVTTDYGPGYAARSMALALDFGSHATTGVSGYADASDDSAAGDIIVLNKRFFTAQAVNATNGDSFAPALTVTGSDVVTDPEDRQNRVYWSKQDRPEAVPVINWADVGPSSEPIVYMMAVRDALYIMKSRGLYRLTGTDELNGWRVDLVDESVALVTSPATAGVPMTVVGQDLYAWDLKGIRRYSEGGFELISHRISDLLSAYPQYGYLVGVTEQNELWVGTGTTVYVYNLTTDTWTEQRVNDNASVNRLFVAYDYKLRTMYESQWDTTTQYLFTELIAPGSAIVAATDMNFGISGTSLSAITATGCRATFSAGSGWTPEIGDVFRAIKSTPTTWNFYGIVTNVVSSTVVDVVFYSLTGTPTATPSSATAYSAVTSTYEFNRAAPADPTNEHVFQRLTHAFVSVQDALSVSATVGSDISTSTYEMEEQLRSDGGRETSPLGRSVEFSVPKEHARARYLRPGMSIRTGSVLWNYAGCAIEFEPGSDRIAMRRNT